MKLIAENEQENRVIHRLTGLLRDLSIDATGYTTQNAAALTFWSCRDLPRDLPDKASFLAEIEDDLYSSMIIAGYETISRSLERRGITQAARSSNT